jgi:uncharacterized protein
MSQDGPDADIIRELFAGLSAADYDAVARLLSEDVELDTPYAPDGYFLHLAGRRQVMEALTGLGDTFEKIVIEADTTYPSVDGETIVVEYHSNGTVKRNGKAYANRYVGIFRLRDGAIALWREYYNPDILRSALS